MKKAIFSTVAALVLGAASTGAFADAECQAGSAWGGKPGCGNAVVVPQAQPQVYGGVDRGSSGWSPDMAYGQPQGYYYYGGLPGVRGQVFSDGRGVPQYQQQTPYTPTQRDRDGDGIRNNRDRYPDDPRYR